MMRNDLVRVTHKVTGDTREGYFMGSGDWGVRFYRVRTNGTPDLWSSFSVEDWEWSEYTFEVI
jgi:hypothetical protein